MQGPARAPDPAAAADPWYREGLPFACTQCGNCCTGGPGAVWFTAEEGRSMAALLGLDEDVFLARHTRPIGVRRSLRERRTIHGHDCVFLDRERVPGKAVCAIYAARPMQCRTWPFWPENVETPQAWEDAKRRTPCPGMGQGEARSFVEIRMALDLDRKREPFGG